MSAVHNLFLTCKNSIISACISTDLHIPKTQFDSGRANKPISEGFYVSGSKWSVAVGNGLHWDKCKSSIRNVYSMPNNHNYISNSMTNMHGYYIAKCGETKTGEVGTVCIYISVYSPSFLHLQLFALNQLLTKGKVLRKHKTLSRAR